MDQTIKFVPKNTPYLEARFLSEDEQAVYEEATKQFRNERAQNSLRIPRNGSNLFKVLLLNQIGIRTATLPELDQIIQANDSFLRGIYDTPSVALRGNGDFYPKNDYLAKSLAELIRKRNFNIPVVISGLKLEEDENSPYGLGFKKRETFGYFEAPELSHSNDKRRFTRQDERGMPVFDNNGSRILYTRNDGLSWLGLGRDLDLYSVWDGLDYSLGGGRVVVVSAEGTRKK